MLQALTTEIQSLVVDSPDRLVVDRQEGYPPAWGSPGRADAARAGRTIPRRREGLWGDLEAGKSLSRSNAV